MNGTISSCNEFVEALADYAHAAWSGWMRYLFSKCMRDKDESTTIPGWAVERWVRQMNTAYRDLPEGEKESDRAEARKILEVIHRGEKMKLEDANMTVTLDAKELIKAIDRLEKLLSSAEIDEAAATILELLRENKRLRAEIETLKAASPGHVPQ